MTFKLIYYRYKDVLPKPSKANDNDNNMEAECSTIAYQINL